uniref:Uncharacterized protein n=1 Tax=Romanomermis culicivorax TaxID=13658 RepID=A0A915L7A6_ROMCU
MPLHLYTRNVPTEIIKWKFQNLAINLKSVPIFYEIINVQYYEYRKFKIPTGTVAEGSEIYKKTASH